MGKRRFQLSERTVGIIILAILLLAGMGIYICMKTYVMPEPVPTQKVLISEEMRAFVSENEELLLQAMDLLHEEDALKMFYRETPVNDLYCEKFWDGVQLWSFELDSTNSFGVLGGSYYNLFYCETNPRDRIYDWFGDRTGMWEDMGIAQRYLHNGNEIYLEELGNNFWFGYCYC